MEERTSFASEAGRMLEELDEEQKRCRSYNNDLVAWSKDQSKLLRRLAQEEPINIGALDLENIAEEIESVGRSERSALASRVQTIIEHLVKLEVSAATNARVGWIETVLRSRAEIERLLEDSPSLHSDLDEIVGREHRRALRLVASALALHGETPRRSLDEINYAAEQVIGPWLP